MAQHAGSLTNSCSCHYLLQHLPRLQRYFIGMNAVPAVFSNSNQGSPAAGCSFLPCIAIWLLTYSIKSALSLRCTKSLWKNGHGVKWEFTLYWSLITMWGLSKAMNLYNLNDVNSWLRWMVKVCSMEENFVSTVHIGSLHSDSIAGYKSSHYSTAGH